MSDAQDFVRRWTNDLVAPAVLISIVGGAATAGYLFGRNELTERIAVLEQRQISHDARAAHAGAVNRAEYEVTIANMAEDVGEIKATLEIMRAEIRDLRRNSR